MMKALFVVLLVRSVAFAAPICPTPAKLMVAQRVAGFSTIEISGKLVVEGVPTTVAWPGMAPNALRLADGRTLLEDFYSDTKVMYVWDPKTLALTSLGKSEPIEIPRLGVALATRDPRDGWSLHDLDPKKPALRLAWRTREVPMQIGVLDGAVAFVAGKDLVCIGSKVTKKPLALPAGFQIANSDAVRGHRVLLRRFVSALDVDVAILDLDTGKHRVIGKAKVGVRLDTDESPAELDLAWVDGATSGHGSVTNFVDVRTEALTTRE
jgi:hypothetical protein